MPDPLANFYGGYDPSGLPQLPRLRIRPIYAAIAVATIVLVIFVAADAAAVDNFPATVHVSSVDWFAEGTELATSAGFTVHASQTFIVTETCQLFCYNFDGATVGAPFHLVRVTIVNQPVQFTNVTIQAPSGTYNGPLTVTLELG